ncbi:villin-like protein [Pseudonaja textilis]|uniref:villin-like protein n=1 Tax=Pseudonaja textilis TaxID=8673 RepID=UPI000EA9136B|nr:villin-like protein [Pseudonaja textilis]
MTDVEREMGLPPIEQKPGLQIWTIKDMKMEPIPAKAYGSFFEGDCYIILNHTKMQHRFTTDLHFWIGRNASQDEQGAAAFYVTQIDDSLQGTAIQHREVQGHESAAFKSYFKKGIIYKKGGLASGFKHVETNMYNIKRLLHVKGKKHVSATEVDLSWDNFNKGDVFLLDLGKVLIQWNGPSCNIAEKSKGMILARSIRDGERGGRAQIAVIDNEKDCPELMQIMKATLGERNQEIREPLPDEKADEHQKANVRLYHVYENGKDLVVQEIATRPLTQDLLSHEDCHIIDQGGLKIYVWRGKESSKEEKNAAFSRAVGFIQAKGYPSSTNIEVVNDGAESAMFKQLFQKWTEKYATQGLGKGYTLGKIAKVDQTKFDITQLYMTPEVAAEERMADDASGKVEVGHLNTGSPSNETASRTDVSIRGFLALFLPTCFLFPLLQIFLWVGKTANSYEKTESVSAAKEYLKNHPAGRDVATPIITVKQGHEPLNFTGWFTAWDPYKWSDGKSYEQMKSSLGDVSAISEITMDLKNANFSHRSSSNKPVTANAEISEAQSSLQDNQTLTHSSNCSNTNTTLQEANEIGTFPRDLLINKTVDELPEGVDPTKKEYFLSDAEFFDIFGKTKDAFYQMPTWKQQNEKKQFGLF